MSTARGRRTAAGGTSRRGPLPSWLRKTADKVPTAWFGAILTGVFLAVTAAFGSLNTAPVAAPRTVSLGETVTTDLYEITVTDVAIVSPPPDTAARLKEPSHQVRLTATVTNLMPDAIALNGRWMTWHDGFVSVGEGSVLDIGVPATYVASQYADSYGRVMLQPQLPTDVVVAFTVRDEDVPQELSLTFAKPERLRGSIAISNREEYIWGGDAAATLRVVPDVLTATRENRLWL